MKTKDKIEIHGQCTASAFTHCGVCIGLKKAFNTIDHNVLLDKLNFYIFLWINQPYISYLKNCTQTTQIPDHISNKATIRVELSSSRFHFRPSSPFAVC